MSVCLFVGSPRDSETLVNGNLLSKTVVSKLKNIGVVSFLVVEIYIYILFQSAGGRREWRGDGGLLTFRNIEKLF